MNPTVLAPPEPSLHHAVPPSRPARPAYMRAVWTASFGLLAGVSLLVAVCIVPARFTEDDLWVTEKLWAWAGVAAGVAALAAMWRFRPALLTISARRWTVAILLAALAARAGLLLTVPYVPAYDFCIYHQSAIGVSQHGGMTIKADSRSGYQCYYPPGQVYTLGALYRVFGDAALQQIPASRVPVTPEQWDAFYGAARVGMWFNALLGSLTVAAIYGIGRRMFGEFPGRVASVLACVAPSCLFGNFLLGAEVGQTFWVVLAIYAYARWVDLPREAGFGIRDPGSAKTAVVPVSDPGSRIPGPASRVSASFLFGAVLVGECLGMGSLFRPTFLPVAGLLAIHLLLTFADKRRALLAGTAMLLGLAVIVSPWIIRNYCVTGAFIPISSNGGGMLYSGNNDHADGGYTEQAWVELYKASDGDATLHRLGTEKGLAWIRANPGRFAELAVIKFGRFWGTDRDIAWWVLEAPSSFYEKDWSPPGYAHTNIAPSARRAGTGLSTGVYLAILLAAATGLWRHRRALQSRGAWVAVMLIAALFTAVHMIVESQAKYHYTLVPLLCLLAGLCITKKSSVLGPRSSGAHRVIQPL